MTYIYVGSYFESNRGITFTYPKLCFGCNLSLLKTVFITLTDARSSIAAFTSLEYNRLFEPRHEKTSILHMRKQRRRSSSR